MPALQSELAREIAKSLKAAINPEHEARLATRDAFDPAVYDLYLRVVQCRAGAQLRDRAASRWRRPRLERMTPAPIPALMQWHAATGGLTRAFEMMAALSAANNLPPNLAFDPLFEPLRNDDRYAKLLR